MYCICQDETVSIDMSLWKMLGRKISSLGMVVDGARKRLDAVEQDAISSNGEKRNASVEEELTSFFANSVTSKKANQKKSPVVKGSIQSFFKRAKNNEPAKSKSKAIAVGKPSKLQAPLCVSLLDDNEQRICESHKVDASACISLLDDDEDDGLRQYDAVATDNQKPRSKRVGQCHDADKQEIEGVTEEWQCPVCTYINHSESKCAMCDNERQMSHGVSEDVTSDNLQHSLCKG